MKKIYDEPIIEIVEINSADIITVSIEDETGGNTTFFDFSSWSQF